jgi:hypothetical protein
MIRAPTSGTRTSDQRLAEAGVEALGDVARQLDVLALVLADGDLVRPVGEHVGGLQHGIEEQPGRHQVPLRAGLLFELGHPVQISERGHRREQPAELGVLVHIALAEEDAAARIQPGCEQRRGSVVDRLAQHRWFVGDRDRVQVDDAVDRLAAVLSRDVLGDRPDVVAEVLAAGRLDAGEDAHSSDERGGYLASAPAGDCAPRRR